MKWKKILQEKPKTGASKEEFQSWKERVKKARAREEVDYERKARRSEDRWTGEEWKKMKRQLNALSLNQLQNLAIELGIEFEGGIESIKDRKVATAKEQIILVLDEVDRDKLVTGLERIVGPSRRN